MWQNVAYMVSTAWRIKEKKVLVLCFLSAVFAVAKSLAELFVTPTVLACVENGDSVAKLMSAVGIFTLLTVVFSAAAAYVDENTMFGRVQTRMEIVSRINEKCMLTAYPNIMDENFRKACSKAIEPTQGNRGAAEAVWTTLTDLLKNTAGFIIYLALLSTLDIKLILVISVTTLVSYFVGKKLNGYGYRHKEEIAEYERKIGYINRRSADRSAAKDIRIFGLRPWLEDLYAKALNSYTAFRKKENGIYFGGSVADLVLAFLRNGFAYAYLIGLAVAGKLSASEFLLYFSAVGGFTAWVGGILSGLKELHKQSVEISTIREFTEYPEPFALDEGEHIVPDANAEYEIKLEDVSFRYDGCAENILEHINLTLRPGEKIAVVGLNGAGKTTLVKLICGFYDPTEGRVLLNGKDIREYNRRDYYTLFSAVFQEFSVLPATIAANVAQTETDIDYSRVADCLERAGLTQKISSLPNGVESLLNRDIYEDAVDLSGGEMQRLMLARALYKDSPVILLDEPTAALDPISERELYEKYNEMTHGRSSVYISHRLASTRFCDRIILVENKGIAEQGTHSELLAKGGRYAELFGVQSKYYRKGDECDEKTE